MNSLGREAIEGKRAREALQRARDELERQVRECAEALAQTNETLRASEEKYRALVDEIGDGLFMVDAQGVITMANRALAQIHGVVSPEQLLGRKFLELVGPAVRNRMEELFIRAVETGKPVGVVETEIVRPDGKSAHVEVTPVAVFEGRKVVGFRGVLRDVTERKRLEEQLRQAQKLEAVGLLAGGVAHDFNTLLNGIIGFSELAERQMPEGREGASYLSRIREMGRQAADLVRQLLSFAQMAPLERKPLDLNVLLKEVGKMLQRTLPEMITIQVQPSDKPLIVNADVAQMQQIMLNLATNAKDAMPHGGILTLRLAPVALTEASLGGHPERRSGAFACLTVADTGTSIAAAIRDRIFEPFFTTKAPGHGTGLGLSSVHGIVHQHEGWLEVETAEGRGSAFHTFLPLAPVPAPAAPSPAEALPRGNETLLLVEDNPMVRELGEIFLSDLGYTVFTAADGVEALAAFRAHPGIAVVLTDAIMPRMGAAELIPTLRALNPEIRVVVATGYAADEIQMTLDHLGVSGYIRKPFCQSDLARAVRAAIDGEAPGRG